MALAVFIARLLLGALLLVAGILKAHDGPTATASTIAGFRILPATIVAPLGVALPYLEILIGGYLVVGLFTRIVAAVAAFQFVVFAIAVGSLVVRHISANCGCFGSGVNTPPSWGHVASDLALALFALAIARYAPGAFALDDRLGLSGSPAPDAEG
jgi:uncharacterized membrane protein YphA (DoxX/SURF4 family)